ncbi:MAG: efflux RND transporter periplasmic adaptor subunit, partial [Hyphomicrobium sp.]
LQARILIMAEAETLKTSSGALSHWSRALFLSFAGLAFVGAMAGGVLVLHGRASAERSPNPNPPLVVDTRRIDLRDAYAVNERFVGLLEPARQTRLSFERPGLVNEVLFDEGDQVSDGDVVARLDASKLKSERRGLEARLQELEAQFDLASVTLSRQSALKKKGWQSEQKYDEARFKAAQLSSAIRRLKASIESIDIDIAKSELKAPYSGTVAVRSIDEGSVVSAGTPVIDVVEAGVRRVRVGISVEASDSIEADQSYRLVSGGQNFDGRLISKRPDLQTGTRTVIALFEISGAEDVPFGEIVELVVERPVMAHGAWLPISALTEGSKGLWTVLTVVEREDGPSVVREAVEVLHAEQGRAFVRGNLGKETRVVVNGTNRIIPGQRVALAVNVPGKE